MKTSTERLDLAVPISMLFPINLGQFLEITQVNNSLVQLSVFVFALLDWTRLLGLNYRVYRYVPFSLYWLPYCASISPLLATDPVPFRQSRCYQAHTMQGPRWTGSGGWDLCPKLSTTITQNSVHHLRKQHSQQWHCRDSVERAYCLRELVTSISTSCRSSRSSMRPR